MLAQQLRRIATMEWLKLTQYRTDLVLWTIATTMSSLVAMALWYSVAKESGENQLAHTTLIYYIFAALLTTTTLAWSGYYIAQDILDGNMAKYLLKPFSVFWFHIINNIMEKSIRLLIPIPALIALVIIFPSFFKDAIVSTRNIPVALLAIFFAAVIAFLIDALLGLIAFWLADAMQIRRYQDLLYQITSGILIPYSFLPKSIHTIFSFLPYRYIISAPAEILSGQITGWELGKIIAIQTAWILLLFIITSVVWKRGLTRYAPPG